MELCVLGSGSGGNASVVRAGGRCVLIDAGFGPRTVAKRLAGTGVTLDDLAAVMLTHLDSDHFAATWLAELLRRRIPLYVHERHLYHLHQREHDGPVTPHVLHREGLLAVFNSEPLRLESIGASVRPVPGVHDSGHSVGFRIETPAGVLAYATDLGRADDHLIDAMTDADLIAIESNYCPRMQMASSRPMALKKRIMGGRGHLSNEEAATAVARAVERSARPPRHVVLLHLSRQCNAPAAVRAVFRGHPHLAARLCITSQHTRTDWLRLDGATELPGEQLTLRFA